MTEPDVTITDYLLALEAGLFAALIDRSGDAASQLRAPFVVFFAATAAAAAAGGTVHGFFAGHRSGIGRALWRATMLAIGVAAYATWVIACRLFLTDGAAGVVQGVAGIVAIAYAAVVIAVDDRFSIAVAHYLPPAFVLMVAFAVQLARDGGGPALAGFCGTALTFVAAVVQQQRITLHARFDHNALYHAIQAIALGLVFTAAREVV